MNIVHILLTPRFGGTERHVVELANAQARNGAHQVTVILHRRAADARPDAYAHRFDPRVKQVLVGGWKALAIFQARRALRVLAPDVAHAHLRDACRVLDGVEDLCLRVATLHICYRPRRHRDMDALIAIAPWQLPTIEPLQRAHTAQIDNWISAAPADPEARRKLRAQLGVADDELLIGTLGRIDARKGLDLLIDAFVAVQTQGRSNGARLVIAGAGRDWQRVRGRAPASIIMPGFVEQPQDWLSAFDAYVSAARSEAFGLVFLEAMAAGLPVLATASQGARFFERLIARPLVPLGDMAALRNALATLIAARPVRLNYDLRRFAYANKVAEVEAFYRQELAARSRTY